jgi:hypothetical protein
MSWAELFDRAADYGVTVDDVRATLAERRAGNADESEPEDGGNGER